MSLERLPLIARQDVQTEFRAPRLRFDLNHATAVLREHFPRATARTFEDWEEAIALSERVLVERGPHGLIARFDSGDCLIARTHRATTLGLFIHTSYPHDPALKTALILAVGLGDPDFRARLTESPWRRITQRILAGTSEPEAKKKAKRSQGWIRAVLSGETYDHRGLANGALTLQLIRLGARTGEPLKPQKAPKDEAGLEARLVAPSDGDRRIVQLAERRRILEQRDRHRWGSNAVNEADGDLFAALGGVTEVYFERTPITIGRGEFRPALALIDGEEGPLLTWREKLVCHWGVGAGFVLDEGHVLWAVPPRLRQVVPELIHHLPMVVPPDEVEDFVESFVVPAPVPVDLRSERVKVKAGAPEPRLLLVDDGGRLVVDVRFEYDGLVIPEGAGSVFETLGGLVQRDLDAENALRAELAAITGQVPARYHGEAAFDFLFDDLPRLAKWAIDADRKLLKKVGGRVSPQVRFESGADWFDLAVEFAGEGLAVGMRDVIAAWRAGRRYVELKDGKVAKLPDAWLDKHGETVAELVDIRRHRKKRMGVHIAPLVDDLLDEAQGAREAIDRWNALATKAQAFTEIPERAPPRGLRAELRGYQALGYRWLAALADLGLAGVLADDMGLGKTIQTLAWILDRRERGGEGTPPVLVVAPTSVVFNWVSEAERFTPSLRVHLNHGASRGELPAAADVIVTSYALLRRDLDKLTAHTWGGVVLDEAQAIKNPDSQVAKAARAIAAPHRFALSGTPLENHLVELWSLFEFLLPGFFAGREHFRKRYVKPIQQDGDHEAMARLRGRIRPFVLRRLKREVASELPPRTEQVLMCELGPGQRRAYEAIREDYRDSVVGHLQAQGLGKSTFHVLEALTRLRQACCDPALLPARWGRGAGSAKRTLALSLLDELIEEGHRALVFSQWPRSLQGIAAELQARGHRYLYLDGATRKRADLQAQWNDPLGPPVFLISIKAGGSGLNLTGADHVLHLDPWWNPAVENQATDRAHRIGQDKPVVVYKLVAKDTVEEKILKLQALKQDLFDRTVEQDRAWVTALNEDDVTDLFADGSVAISPRQVDEDPLPGLLATHPVLTNKVVREAIGGTAAEARRLLTRWVSEGHLVQEGRARGTRYKARVKARRAVHLEGASPESG